MSWVEMSWNDKWVKLSWNELSWHWTCYVELSWHCLYLYYFRDGNQLSWHCLYLYYFRGGTSYVEMSWVEMSWNVKWVELSWSELSWHWTCKGMGPVYFRFPMEIPLSPVDQCISDFRWKSPFPLWASLFPISDGNPPFAIFDHFPKGTTTLEKWPKVVIFGVFT